MNTLIISSVLAVLCVSTSLAQFSPLTFAALGGEMDSRGRSYLMYSQLNRRIAALEFNLKTGAVGGCESGVIGPMSASQNTAVLKFKGQFLSPPAVSLSTSDLVTSDSSLPINYQIRPTQIDQKQVTITVTDTSNNIASLHVAYMICPSNSAFAV